MRNEETTLGVPQVSTVSFDEVRERLQAQGWHCEEHRITSPSGGYCFSDEIRFMEDGYAVVLSSASTARLIETLRNGGALAMGKGESRVLRVVVS
jgi:hypothetical protein